MHARSGRTASARPLGDLGGLHDSNAGTASPQNRIAKSKQATAAGAAVAKGVATGMQAATVEIGTSLMGVAGSKSRDSKEESGLMAQPAVKAVGGVGMEILRVRR
jgi:hypothetical protein